MLVALAGLVGAAVGCGGGDTDGSATAASASSTTSAGGPSTTSTTARERADGAAVPSADGPAVPSAGCDAGPTPAASLEKRTLPVAELTRWYLITVPAGATEPMPLVLDLHGLSEGAEIHAQMTGMGDAATSHGFVAVLPNGSGNLNSWAAGPGGEADRPNPDVDFVAALLDEVERDVCIDVSRVYATGLSNGAMMTSMLACRLAGRLAAVAPIAGATDFGSCDPGAVVPMLTIHGTADPILRFNGGVGDLVKLISGGAAAPTDATAAPTTTVPLDLDGAGYPANVAAWAERNGCEPAPTDTDVTDSVIRRTYDCPAGADVEMYIVGGGGHAWPSSEFSRGIEKIVGPTTFDIDATELVWEFFQRFRRAP